MKSGHKIRKKITLVTSLFTFWLIMTASFDFFNLITGLLASSLVCYIIWKPLKAEKFLAGAYNKPVTRILYSICFIFVFLKALIYSSFNVASNALTYKLRIEPGVIYYTSELKKDFSLVLLAHYITLTPGTLTINIDSDSKQFCIHCLDKNNPNIISDIKSIEQWLRCISE